MEEKTCERRQGEDARRCSVEPIAQDGMTDACQMHSYLVGTSRSDANAKECADGELLENLIFSKCRSSRAEFRGHPCSPDRVASNGRRDRPALLPHSAMDERQVHFFHLAALELGGKRLMSEIRSCHRQDTARLLVQPMNNSRTKVAIDRG